MPAPLGARGEAVGPAEWRAPGQAVGPAERGARGQAAGEAEAAGATGATGAAGEGGGEREGSRAAGRPPASRPSLGSPATHATILAVSLVAYAALATAVVEGGWLVSLDEGVSEWVARSMPTWAEWAARVFSWVGGAAGATIVSVAVCLWLLVRRDARGVLWVAAAGIGSQVLIETGKLGYDRSRPTAGSPIELPSSYSFPSGHAASGAALFGILGLVLARHLATRPARRASVAAGFAIGALVAASRVVLNVHFVSDVLAGAALGLAWLTLCLLAPVVVADARRLYADRS